MLSQEPQGTPGLKGSLSAAEAGPIADLWRRCRSHKLLDPLTSDPAEPRRLIELDVIVAGARAWAASDERLDPGWDPIDLDGIIFAERTVG